MYSLLVSIALTFLCFGTVIVHAHPAELEDGQDTQMQYLHGFQLQEDNEVN